MEQVAFYKAVGKCRAALRPPQLHRGAAFFLLFCGHSQILMKKDNKSVRSVAAGWFQNHDISLLCSATSVLSSARNQLEKGVGISVNFEEVLQSMDRAVRSSETVSSLFKNHKGCSVRSYSSMLISRHVGAAAFSVSDCDFEDMRECEEEGSVFRRRAAESWALLLGLAQLPAEVQQLPLFTVMCMFIWLLINRLGYGPRPCLRDNVLLSEFKHIKNVLESWVVEMSRASISLETAAPTSHCQMLDASLSLLRYFEETFPVGIVLDQQLLQRMLSGWEQELPHGTLGTPALENAIYSLVDDSWIHYMNVLTEGNPGPRMKEVMKSYLVCKATCVKITSSSSHDEILAHLCFEEDGIVRIRCAAFQKMLNDVYGALFVLSELTFQRMVNLDGDIEDRLRQVVCPLLSDMSRIVFLVGGKKPQFQNAHENIWKSLSRKATLSASAKSTADAADVDGTVLKFGRMKMH